jgi:hypothetical protein
MSNKTCDHDPLPQGKLADIFIETLARSGVAVQDIGADTPIGLMIRIARWDGLMNQAELSAVRQVVSELSTFPIGIAV